MLTSSTVSVPIILTGESCQGTAIFTIELTRGQALSPTFMNDDIIVGLVYKHTNVEPVVVQKLYAKVTLLVFPEGKEVEKICRKLESIELWLGHTVKIGCDIATPDQKLIGGERRNHIRGRCEHTVA